MWQTGNIFFLPYRPPAPAQCSPFALAPSRAPQVMHSPRRVSHDAACRVVPIFLRTARADAWHPALAQTRTPIIPPAKRSKSSCSSIDSPIPFRLLREAYMQSGGQAVGCLTAHPVGCPVKQPACQGLSAPWTPTREGATPLVWTLPVETRRGGVA